MTGFQIKDRIDNFIYLLYNTYTAFRFFLNFKLRKKLKRNLIFKNRHESQRCFILGCGPSLKDLNKKQLLFLEKEITIGVNDLFRSSFLKKIIPNYYFLVDNAYWTDQINTSLEVFDFYKDKKTLFFTSEKARKYLKSNSIDSNRLYYLYANSFPINSISGQLDKNQTICINVVTQAIQTAMYMGFKEIYLLGCDYTAFATPLDTHCYGDNISNKTQNLAFYLKYYELATRIHYLVAKKASKDKVSIFNLTDNSLLDAYPKQRMDELFSI